MVGGVVLLFGLVGVCRCGIIDIVMFLIGVELLVFSVIVVVFVVQDLLFGEFSWMVDNVVVLEWVFRLNSQFLLMVLQFVELSRVVQVGMNIMLVIMFGQLIMCLFCGRLMYYFKGLVGWVFIVIECEILLLFICIVYGCRLLCVMVVMVVLE